MAKSKKYTDEQFIDAVKTSFSIRETLVKLGLKPAGGNSTYIRIIAHKLGVDCSHFKGRNHFGNDKHIRAKPKITIEEMLVENSRIHSSHLKRRLMNSGLLEYKCYECGICSWNSKDLTLQLDHINGIANDNRIINLRLLCPNCHSQTETFCGRNYKRVKNKPKVFLCIDCGKNVSKKNNRCRQCGGLFGRKDKITWPSNEEFISMVKNSNYSIVAKKLGVDKSTVANRFKCIDILSHQGNNVLK